MIEHTGPMALCQSLAPHITQCTLPHPTAPPQQALQPGCARRVGGRQLAHPHAQALTEAEHRNSAQHSQMLNITTVPSTHRG